jgi:hypothetical protein
VTPGTQLPLASQASAARWALATASHEAGTPQAEPSAAGSGAAPQE